MEVLFNLSLNLAAPQVTLRDLELPHIADCFLLRHSMLCQSSFFVSVV